MPDELRTYDLPDADRRWQVIEFLESIAERWTSDTSIIVSRDVAAGLYARRSQEQADAFARGLNIALRERSSAVSEELKAKLRMMCARARPELQAELSAILEHRPRPAGLSQYR